MFGLRQRFTSARSAVPLVVVHQDSENSEESVEVREFENQTTTTGKGEAEGDMLYSNMRQSFSSISDADVSQTSEEADEEEAVSPPLAVKTGTTPASELDDGGIKHVESPEALENSDFEEKPDRPRARRATRSGSSFSRTNRRDRDSASSSSGTWLGLDASIIIALISPIGNLLTGGDHVKNLLLLALLVYYLHQLVEVPWTLYRMSIPKRTPRSNEDRNNNNVGSTKHAVHDELRALELVYLFLTVVSPFIGAILLRYVATSISGDQTTLSWFSTTLFVLATGIRPWSHLVECLKDRSQALNGILEEMEEDPKESPEEKEIDNLTEVITTKVDEMRRRLDRLDIRLADMSTTNMNEWDDLADVIDSVDDAVKTLRTETVKKEKSQEARLDALEACVLGLQFASRPGPSEPSPLLSYLRGQQLRALCWDIAALPWSIASFTWMVIKRIWRDIQHMSSTQARPQDHSSSTAKGKQAQTQSPRVKFIGQTQPRSRHGSGFGGVRPPNLEPILEEEVIRSDGLPVRVDPFFIGTTANGHATRAGLSMKVQARNPLDPLAYLIARVLVFIFSPVVFVVRCCLAMARFPGRVLRQL